MFNVGGFGVDNLRSAWARQSRARKVQTIQPRQVAAIDASHRTVSRKLRRYSAITTGTTKARFGELLLAIELRSSPECGLPKDQVFSEPVDQSPPRVEAFAGNRYFSRSRLRSARNLCFSSAVTKRCRHWKIGDSVTSLGRPPRDSSPKNRPGRCPIAWAR